MICARVTCEQCGRLATLYYWEETLPPVALTAVSHVSHGTHCDPRRPRALELELEVHGKEGTE